MDLRVTQDHVDVMIISFSALKNERMSLFFLFSAISTDLADWHTTLLEGGYVPPGFPPMFDIEWWI